jgi:hypothetical protein
MRNHYQVGTPAFEASMCKNANLRYLVVVCLVLTVIGEDAHAERAGFTADIGLGVGTTIVTGDGARDGFRPGLAPLAIGLGYYVHPRIALGLRVSGSNYNEDRVVYMNGFYGAVITYEAGNWELHAGAGIALAGIDTLKLYDSQNFSLTPDVDKGRHHIAAAFEFTPAVYGDHTRIGVGLRLEWHWN